MAERFQQNNAGAGEHECFRLGYLIPRTVVSSIKKDKMVVGKCSREGCEMHAFAVNGEFLGTDSTVNCQRVNPSNK